MGLSFNYTARRVKLWIAAQGTKCIRVRPRNYDGAGSNDCFIALPHSGSKKLLHFFMQREVSSREYAINKKGSGKISRTFFVKYQCFKEL